MAPQEKDHELDEVETKLKLSTVAGLSSLCLVLVCFIKCRQRKDDLRFKDKKEVKIEGAKYIGYERTENFAEMEQWREFKDEGNDVRVIGQLSNKSTKYALEESKEQQIESPTPFIEDQ